MSLAPDERLGLDIKRAEQTLMAAKTSALRAHGLTVAQYAALYALAENPGISGAGLARACLVTPQAAAAVLKTLESRGLIARSRNEWNLNVRESALTDAGRRLLAAADQTAVRIEQRMYDALTVRERTQLKRLLAACTDALGTDS
ncbi:MarR family transcriptional regulator [Nocardioidaceae bacterium SCSIO 66511]|nr:MarR family transcriptional regulator [Nocardioidaceae bacterium SCSIO 66511]